MFLSLSGTTSGLLPWGRLTWFGPDIAGAPVTASRWNTLSLYGWGSWEGKAVMAIFLVLALLRLASGFSVRPQRWQAVSLFPGAVAIWTLCYLNTQKRVMPELPPLLSNLVRVELQLGLLAPIVLAIALIVVAAAELHVAQQDRIK